MKNNPPVAIRLGSAILAVVGTVALIHSLGWRGAPFSGFFLLPNRVVPSAALPHWSGVADGRPLYQQVLLAVDDAPVVSAKEAYARAAAHRGDEPVRYLFARETGVETRAFPLRRFTTGEYGAIFGAYFLTSLAYLLLAALAGERWHEGRLYRALTAFGWVGAAWGFTGMDLYGPGQMFRLHVLAEACLPAAVAHLALVCPRQRSDRRPGLVPLLYTGALSLAAVYELFLYEPRAYSAIHNLAQGLASIPVFALAIALGLAASDPAVLLERRLVRRLLAGVLIGLVAPGLVLGISGLSGGLVPVNVTAWVGFVFPLTAIAALRSIPAASPAARSS